MGAGGRAAGLLRVGCLAGGVIAAAGGEGEERDGGECGDGMHTDAHVSPLGVMREVGDVIGCGHAAKAECARARLRLPGAGSAAAWSGAGLVGAVVGAVVAAFHIAPSVGGELAVVLGGLLVDGGLLVVGGDRVGVAGLAVAVLVVAGGLAGGLVVAAH